MCFGKENLITLVLKDGSEVSGENLGSSNEIYKVRTDSGVVEVNSKDVETLSVEVFVPWDELGINEDDMDKVKEKLRNRMENYSDNQDDQDDQYVEESNDSDNQEESDDSDDQDDSSEEESDDSDDQDED